jgi:hypothetical protein
MLFRFKSRNAGDVIMLEASGKRVLEIIGKDPGPQGIVLPDQIPKAIADLQAAVEQEEADFARAKSEFETGQTREPPDTEAVRLRHRAQPFVDLLRRSQESGDPVVWGV